MNMALFLSSHFAFAIDHIFSFIFLSQLQTGSHSGGNLAAEMAKALTALSINAPQCITFDNASAQVRCGEILIGKEKARADEKSPCTTFPNCIMHRCSCHGLELESKSLAAEGKKARKKAREGSSAHFFFFFFLFSPCFIRCPISLLMQMRLIANLSFLFSLHRRHRARRDCGSGGE